VGDHVARQTACATVPLPTACHVPIAKGIPHNEVNFYNGRPLVRNSAKVREQML